MKQRQSRQLLETITFKNILLIFTQMNITSKESSYRVKRRVFYVELQF